MTERHRARSAAPSPVDAIVRLRLDRDRHSRIDRHRRFERQKFVQPHRRAAVRVRQLDARRQLRAEPAAESVQSRRVEQSDVIEVAMSLFERESETEEKLFDQLAFC